MESKVEINDLRNALRKVPEAMDKELRVAFRDHGFFFRATMIERQFTGFTTSAPREGGRVQNRSGLLRRSFGSEVAGGLNKGSPLTLVVFSSGVKYARMQEYGGTVRPKRGQYLTIPLPDSMTRSGNPRYPGGARQLFTQYPKQISIVKSPKSGKLFIVSDGKPGTNATKGKNAQTQWLYILKKSVTIPPRLGFRSTWRSTRVVNDRIQRLNKAVQIALSRAGLGGGA
jgi:hypothetical protein